MPSSLAMALAVLGVVVAHRLGRYASARHAGLPVERSWISVFMRLGDRDRTGAHLGALVVGGAFAYFAVAAIQLAFGICQGVPTGTRSIVVGQVIADSAAAGKLQEGDQLFAVDGKPLTPGYPPSLSDLVNAGAGAPVTLLIRRGDVPLEVTIQPRLMDPAGATRPGRPVWLLGIQPRLDHELTTDLDKVASVALVMPAVRAGSIGARFLERLSGPSGSDPGGPVRIVAGFREEMASYLAWVDALNAATHALVALALLDLVRVAALLLGWARRRPAA